MADTGSEYASYRVSCMNMQRGRVQNKALSIAIHICSEMGASHTGPVYSVVAGSLRWVFFWVTRRTASSFSATISASVGSAFSWLTLQRDKSQEHVCLLKKGQEKEQEGGFKPDA